LLERRARQFRIGTFDKLSDVWLADTHRKRNTDTALVLFEPLDDVIPNEASPQTDEACCVAPVAGS
jgi:hypothetical protein